MDDVGEADGDDQMDDQEDNEDVTEDEEEGQTMTGPVQRVSKIRWKLFLLQLCIFFDKKL